MTKKFLILAALATLALPAITADVAFARRGADDPVGHVRQGRGTDDGPSHMRRGRGADDAPGHIRRGRGRDDGPSHT